MSSACRDAWDFTSMANVVRRDDRALGKPEGKQPAPTIKNDSAFP